MIASFLMSVMITIAICVLTTFKLVQYDYQYWDICVMYYHGVADHSCWYNAILLILPSVNLPDKLGLNHVGSGMDMEVYGWHWFGFNT